MILCLPETCPFPAQGGYDSGSAICTHRSISIVNTPTVTHVLSYCADSRSFEHLKSPSGLPVLRNRTSPNTNKPSSNRTQHQTIRVWYTSTFTTAHAHKSATTSATTLHAIVFCCPRMKRPPFRTVFPRLLCTSPAIFAQNCLNRRHHHHNSFLLKVCTTGNS